MGKPALKSYRDYGEKTGPKYYYDKSGENT